MTATAGELRDGASAADNAVFEAPAVLRIVWADPQHMAEQIAVWSLARFGPRANASVEKLRGRNPDADRNELEECVIEQQTRVAMTEGAFVGGPFIVLVPLAFCAALLAQAQMVFELAAVAGYEPNDQMRAADLLVLLGAYESPDDATAALAAMSRAPSRRNGKKLPRGTRWAMVKRMAYLLGLFTPDPGYSRFRFIIGWVGIGLLLLVGFVLPLVWVPYLAYSTRRSTLRLAARAREYYAAGGAADAGLIVRRGDRGRASLGGGVALGRTFILLVLPIGAAVIALLTNTSPGGGRWLVAGLIFLGVSFIASFVWLGLRWLRRAGRRIVRPHRAAG